MLRSKGTGTLVSLADMLNMRPSARGFTINEAHVQGDQQKDRLHGKHLERLQQVTVRELLHVDLVLVCLCVDCPVLRGEADLLCSARKQNRSQGLFLCQRLYQNARILQIRTSGITTKPISPKNPAMIRVIQAVHLHPLIIVSCYR